MRVLGRGLGAARGVHLSLRSLREASGKTQVEIARESKMDQADVSRLEARSDFEDCQVTTLRRYVETLGGSLELVARFGDKRISIAGIPRQEKSPSGASPRTTRKSSRRR